MADLPPFERLQGVDRAVLNGLLDELGTPPWKAAYDHVWERDRPTWEAVEKALTVAIRPSLLRPRAERCDAPPPWLATLVRRSLDHLSTNSWGGGRFNRIRLLERLGLVRLDHDATYVLAFISGYGATDATRGPSHASLLRADPDLLETLIWQLFEVEGGGEVSLANIDRFFGSPWRMAFLDLAGDGTIDRERVLMECLGALQRDFNHYRAAWFSATYLALDPTPDERCAHQEGYGQLLRSDLAATVSFALKLIGSVHKESRLDPRETLAALPPAALSRPKGTALAAVKLAGSLGRSDPGLSHLVAAVARNGLEHDHADVQRAAAAILEKLGETVSEQASHLAPSVRAGLGFEAEARMPEASPALQRLRPPPAPISDDDLLERTAALLEDCSDPSELEAVLDGLATLTDAGRLVALRKRARAVVNRGPKQQCGAEWLRGHVAALVLSAEGNPEPIPAPDRTVARFVTGRFSEVRARLLGATASAPLLALPDTEGGFVRASTLVDRLSALTQDPDHYDFVAALLRLHPDGRSDLLPKAAALDGPAAPAVLYALGGPSPSALIGPDAWWVAAARARSPLGVDPLLMDAGLSASGRGRPFARQVMATLRSHRWSDDRGSHTSRYYRWELTSDPFPGTPEDDQPTVFSGEWQPFPELGDWVATLAAIWPHDAEHFLAVTCSNVLDAPMYPATWPDAVPVLDALATHPGRLGQIATAVLTTGLNAAKADQRLHAVDAFVELVGSGRVQASDVADCMASLVPGHTPSRWADSLRAAAASPAGASAAIDVLTSLLPQVPIETRGLSALLDVLHEESLRNGRPATDPELRAWLQRVTGSSRAAKSAKSLLSLSA